MDKKVSYFSKEQRETLKLVGILSVCLLVLLIISVVLFNSITVPTAEPKSQYVEISTLDGMSLSDAKSVLDKAEIKYEIIPTSSKTPNKVEKVEYVGKTEDGKLCIEVGTTVKLHANEVAQNKIVYLTFDDGPIVNYTDNSLQHIYHNTGEILDILEQYGVKATFFLVGEQMVKSDRKHYVNEIYDNGHLIACHSYSHELGSIYTSPSAFMSDIEDFENALKGILGEKKYNSLGKCIRFPGGTAQNGYINKTTATSFVTAVHNMEYKIYDWTVLTNDANDSYRKPGESDRDYFIRSLKESLSAAKGKNAPLIVLMHDRDETKENLPEIIAYLISEGYYFDTIDNCPEYIDI